MSARTNIIGSLLGWGAALLLAASAVAGVVWVADYGPTRPQGGRVTELSATVTSTVNEVQMGTYAIHGKVVRAVTVPGTAMAAWDCTVLDRSGANVGGSALLDRAQSAAETTPLFAIGTSRQWEPELFGSVGLSCTIGTNASVVVRLLVEP